MYITPLSKLLITGIIALTFVGVALSGLFFTENQPRGGADQPAAATAAASKAERDAVIKSLTNNTQNVVFTPQNVQHYLGYLQGAGYASYQFYAQKGQLLTGELGTAESGRFELVLFGPQTRVLKSGTPLAIPANGLYDLRVVFRNDVEQVQESEAQKQRAQPQQYHLTLTLKNPLLSAP